MIQEKTQYGFICPKCKKPSNINDYADYIKQQAQQELKGKLVKIYGKYMKGHSIKAELEELMK